MDAQFWDQRYRNRDQLFSGNPNGVLVTEVSGLPPGQALDVGCGEGADALWLANHGWQVTALDISQVALERAARAAGNTPRVAWTRADLTTTPPPAAAFDLVSIQYFPLPHQPGDTAQRGLLAALAPPGARSLSSAMTSQTYRRTMSAVSIPAITTGPTRSPGFSTTSGRS